MDVFIKQEPLETAAQKIFDLDQEIFCEPLSFPSKKVDEVVEAFEKCVIQMAYDTDKVIGFSAHEKRDDGRVFVKAVGILPVYQGKGVGKKLMENIVHEAGGMGMWLHTHPHNKQAIQFYWKFGFHIAGWKENYFGPGQHRLLMERKGK
jgi:ribosomal protein S18 acetylase RimI-like enzyme